ncbi:MAG: calcium-binding protein [Neisseria sp.]|uniref:calcium-binding protein n=1 Tax=Neisseria sp. TaxID=192066 RepID=UPI0026DD7F2B|nr:calcium-binding protein [Neisseria sp.]MDO4640512.1 calcium-binding protein [Neisseria sp.]
MTYGVKSSKQSSGYTTAKNDAAWCDDGFSGGYNSYGHYYDYGFGEIFWGGSGQDTFGWHSGSCTMKGGAGNDIYCIDDERDLIVEDKNGGCDTVQTKIDCVLGENLENLEAIGSNKVVLTGNACDNVIKGNDADNHINGGDGNDVIHGKGGNDTINGDGGNDTLYGGDGCDTLDGGEGCDTLYGGKGDDILIGGGGEDKLYGGDGNDNLYGSNQADCLYGEKGDDLLDGGYGNDYLNGGAGGDTYIIGAGYGHETIEDCGNSCDTDTVSFKSDINLSDVCFSVCGSDLVVTASKCDTVTIQNWFESCNNQIEEFSFCNGSTITNTQINCALNDCTGSVSASSLLNTVQDQAQSAAATGMA